MALSESILGPHDGGPGGGRTWASPVRPHSTGGQPTGSRSGHNPRTRGLPRSEGSNPADLSAWQQLASALLQEATETGDPSNARAESALEKARALDPENQDTIVGLAVLALSTHNFDVEPRPLAIS